MTAKTYQVLPGKIPTADDYWHEIRQLSDDCPIANSLLSMVEFGKVDREQAALYIVKELLLDRKKLLDEIISLISAEPLPPIHISVNQQRFDEIKTVIEKEKRPC